MASLFVCLCVCLSVRLFVVIIPIGLFCATTRSGGSSSSYWRGGGNVQQEKLLWDVLGSHLKANKMKNKTNVFFFLFFSFFFLPGVSAHPPPAPIGFRCACRRVCGRNEVGSVLRAGNFFQSRVNFSFLPYLL